MKSKKIIALICASMVFFNMINCPLTTDVISELAANVNIGTDDNTIVHDTSNLNFKSGINQENQDAAILSNWETSDVNFENTAQTDESLEASAQADESSEAFEQTDAYAGFDEEDSLYIFDKDVEESEDGEENDESRNDSINGISLNMWEFRPMSNNDPVISPLESTSISMFDTEKATFRFSVEDDIDPLEDILVAISSSNNSLFNETEILETTGNGIYVITFDPELGQSGFAEIIITAVNSSGGSAQLKVDVTVIECPSPTILVIPPESETLTFRPNETKTVNFTVNDLIDSADDIDVRISNDNDTLFETASILSKEPDGSYLLTFIPLNKTVGTATITIYATNLSQKTTEKEIQITVARNNRPPDFSMPTDNYVTAEKAAIQFDITSFFSDLDDDSLSFSINVGQTILGNAAIEDGIVTYTPAEGQTLSDIIYIDAFDGDETTTGQFKIDILPPVARKDFAVCTTADEHIDIYVLDNDDPINENCTLEIVDGSLKVPAEVGSATIKMDLSGIQYIEYKPNPRMLLPMIILTYEVRHKETTLTDEGIIEITVIKVNNKPVIEDLDSVLTGIEGQELKFNFVVRDVDILQLPEDHLGIEIQSDNSKILKNDNTNISYTVTNLDSDTENAVKVEVTLTFEEYANTDILDNYGNLNLEILVWDEDESGVQIVAEKISQVIPVMIQSVNNAPELTILSESFVEIDPRVVTFSEDDGSYQFIVDVYDPDMRLDYEDHMLTVVSDTENVLSNDIGKQQIEITFLERFADERTARYQVTLTPPKHANTEQVEYSFNPVTLNIEVTDVGGLSDAKDLEVHVTQVNDPPTAKNLSYAIDEDETIEILVENISLDPDGIQTVFFDEINTDGTSVQGGIITFKPEDGGKKLIYTPKQYYYGNDEFYFTVIDECGANPETAEGQLIRYKVSIKLDFINYAPVFTLINESEVTPYETEEEIPIEIVLEVFDVETKPEDMGVLMLQIMPVENTSFIQSCTVLDVDPADPYKRKIQIIPQTDKNSWGDKKVKFKLVLSDGVNEPVSYVYLNIKPVNDKPKAGTLNLTFVERLETTDSSVLISLAQMKSVCSDVDTNEGDKLYIKDLSSSPLNGTISDITYNANEEILSFVYTPNLYFEGTETITFIVRDSAGTDTDGNGADDPDSYAEGKIVLNGSSRNAPPLLDPISDVLMNEDEEKTISIQFSDPDNARNYLIIAINSNNERVLNKDSFEYTLTQTGCDLKIHPRLNQFAENPAIEVTFTVSDGEKSVSETFYCEVTPVPDVPNVPVQEFYIRDATALRMDLLLECTDPDPDDTLTLTALTASSSTPDINGTLNSLGNNIWTYTSTPGFNGTIELDYTVTGAEDGLSDTNRVIIHVSNTDIGASIRRIPNLIVLTGQELPTYPLVVEGLTPGTSYELSVVVLDNIGPVKPYSFMLDSKGTSLAIPSSGQSPQEHTLNFKLLDGVIGISLVRVTMTYEDDLGNLRECFMTFSVDASNDNEPPTTAPIPETCDEGRFVDIDILDYVTDREDPFKLQLKIGGISNVTYKVDGNPSSANTNIVIMYDEEGRPFIRFTSPHSSHNAHRSHVYTFDYTVVDSGGVTSTDTVTVTMNVPNHAPYTNLHIRTVDYIDRKNFITFPADSSNDYDGDARVLVDVWEIVGQTQPGVSSLMITDPVTGAVTFCAGTPGDPNDGTPGWYYFRYQVKSSFDPGAETVIWDYSSSFGGNVMIGVRDADGKIPPYFTSHNRTITEDCSLMSFDITGNIYADETSKGKDVKIEILNSSSYMDKFETAEIEKKDVGGVYQYWLHVKPKPNANHSDGTGINTNQLPRFNLKITQLESDGTPGSNYYDGGSVTMYITPENDIPVITSAPTMFSVNTGANETFYANVTDVDFMNHVTGIMNQEDCDKQINISIATSDVLVVDPERCAVIPPDETILNIAGTWGIQIRGRNAGICTITLTATDQEGAIDTWNVVVTVSGQNFEPVAEDHNIIVSEDKKMSITVFNEDSDANGDPLTIEIMLDAAQIALLPGTPGIEGDKITFMPFEDFCHEAVFPESELAENWDDQILFYSGQFFEIPYRLYDGVDYSEEKIIKVHYNPINDAPRFVALVQEHTMDEGQTGIIKLRVLDVDSSDLVFSSSWDDQDGGNPLAEKVERIVVSNRIISSDEYGTLYEVTLEIDNIQYRFHKPEDLRTMITVNASDSHVLNPKDTTVVLKLTIDPTNDAPLLIDSNNEPIIFETWEDVASVENLAQYFWDPDGDTLKILSLSAKKHGSVANFEQNAKFIPDENYFTADITDADQFGWYDFVITDGSTGRTSGQVKILIKPVNDPPILKAATASTIEDTAVEINLWQGAYNQSAIIWDIDNDQDELIIETLGNNANRDDGKTEKGGKVSVDSQGRLITYTPADDFFGTDTFYYVVFDGTDKSSQRVTVTVAYIDDAPRANFQGTETWCPPPMPRVEVEPSDIPNPCWIFNEDTTGIFQFRVWDVEGSSVITKFTTTAPETLIPKANFSLTGSGENLVMNMIPTKNAFGTFEITFTLGDGTKTSIYTIPVQIKSVNDPPVINAQNITVQEDGTYLTGVITATDVENDLASIPLIFSLPDSGDVSHPGPQNGTAVVKTDGTYTYTPNANYFGTDAFYIKVTDNDPDGSQESFAKIGVSVTAVNDPPETPTNVVLNKAHYRGGEMMVVSWTAGEDLLNETNREVLKYDIQLFNGISWVTITEKEDCGGNAGNSYACNYTIPGSFTSGINYEAVKVRIRTWDDGKCYFSGNQWGATQTALPSLNWAESAAVKIDSTGPEAVHLLLTEMHTLLGDYTNQNVIIQIVPNDGTDDWQSGFNTIVEPPKIDWDYDYYYIATSNGTYTFELIDNVGNTVNYEVPLQKIDRVKPKIEANIASIASAQNITVADETKITLTYTDPAANPLDPITGDDVVSQLKTKQYELVRNGAALTGVWEDYNGPIVLPLKGTYSIYCRAEDYAGNITTETFGSYEINNSAPVAVDKTAEIYRINISDTKLDSQTIKLEATDADVEDKDDLTYAWNTTAQDYIDLKVYADLDVETVGNTQYWILTHKGGKLLPDDLNDLAFELPYYAIDSEGKYSAASIVKITLYPVNYLPDMPTTGIGPVAQTLKGGDTGFQLDWDDGSDEETAASLLVYQVRYKTSETGTWSIWNSTVAGDPSYTMTVPAIDTEHFQFEVRVLDDNVSPRINPDGTTGSGYSAAKSSPIYRIDNTAPIIEFEPSISNTTWTNGSVQIDVTITDEGTGRSGLASITGGSSGPESFSVSPVVEQYFDTNIATDNESEYEYRATDHMGNETTTSYKVVNIDKLKPVVTADNTAQTENGYAMVPIKVNLTYTDQDAQAMVSGKSDVDGAKKYYRVYLDGETPGTYLAYSGEITVSVRGTYYIDAYCVDRAGNSSDVKTFGPYIILNSVPQATPNTLNVYEHAIVGDNSKTSIINIQMTGTDADIEDEPLLTYKWVEDTEYHRLVDTWGGMTPTGAAGSGSYQFEHDGSSVEALLPDADRTFTLTFEVTDSELTTDNAAIEITMIPVNDAPTKPVDFTLTTTGYYKGGQDVTVTWDAGTDEETTDPTNLAYVIYYSLEIGRASCRERV